MTATTDTTVHRFLLSETLLDPGVKRHKRPQVFHGPEKVQQRSPTSSEVQLPGPGWLTIAPSMLCSTI